MVVHCEVSIDQSVVELRDPACPVPALPRVGQGYNNVLVSYSMTPGDDPTGRTVLRTFRHTSSRFPVGGIKSPHDGIIKIRPEDFVAGCQSAVQPTP